MRCHGPQRSIRILPSVQFCSDVVAGETQGALMPSNLAVRNSEIAFTTARLEASVPGANSPRVFCGALSLFWRLQARSF